MSVFSAVGVMRRCTARLVAPAATALLTLACASGAPIATPAAVAPATPFREPSCLAVSFGPWSGPTGPLAVSSGVRLFELTPDLAPSQSRAPFVAPQLRLARLIGGPSFGDLAPDVPPTWAPTSQSGSLVIAVADTSSGVSIELVRSDSGLTGLATARTQHMVRDSSGTYTMVAARTAVRARPVPCQAARNGP